MTLAFIILAVGAMLLGGAWSFLRQRKPIPATVVLAVLAVICIVIALWRIQQG